MTPSEGSRGRERMLSVRKTGSSLSSSNSYSVQQVLRRFSALLISKKTVSEAPPSN